MPLYRIRCDEPEKAEKNLKKVIDRQQLLFGLYMDVGYYRESKDILYHFEYKKGIKGMLTRGNNGAAMMDMVAGEGLKKLKQRFKKERIKATIVLEKVDYEPKGKDKKK